jgi:hypothetical protein
MAQGRANKKAKKEQEASVVPVMAITILTTDTNTQSSQPGISTLLEIVQISFNQFTNISRISFSSIKNQNQLNFSLITVNFW